MKLLKMAFLDFDSSSGLSVILQSILQSCPSLAIQVTQESIPTHESHPRAAISNFLKTFKGDLIFLIRPSARLKEARFFLRTCQKEKAPMQVIGIVEGAKPHEAMDLLKMGMIDFITPPLTAVDVLPRIWRILEKKTPSETLIHSLKSRIGLCRMVGKSPPFQAEIDKIPLVAKCDVSVLISGETGTGKELFARAIHYLSPRASRPFIPVSCGAIPLELVENELFGHVQGAFTGASSPQAGLLQEAHGGTLFLDEIDCLPLLAQVKFLRFLQEREYKQLGSAKVHHADVRVIAATNVDLEKSVKEAKFRQDLFYRLNVVPLALPPLRERPEDISLLAHYFMEKYSMEFNKGAKEFTDEALRKLMTYEWPGNVRELENVVERSVVFSAGSVIHQTDIILPRFEKPERESFRSAKSRAIKQFEKRYIQEVLCTHKGNISRAAEASQKNRRAFWELIRRHEIDTQRFKFG